jgi:hypothetical protein
MMDLPGDLATATSGPYQGPGVSSRSRHLLFSFLSRWLTGSFSHGQYYSRDLRQAFQ